MLYLFKTAWIYAEKERWKIVLLYFLHSLSFAGVLFQPYSFGKAINLLQVNGIGNIRPTLFWLSMYLVGFLAFQVFHHTARYFELTVAYTMQKNFVDDMYGRVYSLPIQWHTNNHSGELVNRINTASFSLRDYGFMQHEMLGNLLLSVGPVFILINYSWKYSMICIGLTLVNLVVVTKMNLLIQPILHSINEETHAYTAKLFDFIVNIRTVINLHLKEETNEVLNHKFNHYVHERMREFKINQPRCFISASGTFITELVLILFFLWSASEAGGVIIIGSLIAIVNYFKTMSTSFFDITNTFYDTMDWKTSLQSVSQIVTTSDELTAKSVSVEVESWEHIANRNLHFSYDNQESTLRNINLDLRTGSKVAIIGSSGSGKSTLIHLLAGFHTPSNGDLIIDGIKINDFHCINQMSLLAPQDIEIFENTIRYNITFGMDYDEKYMEKILVISRFSEVLKGFPKGLDTDIREKGVNLSGG
ncbi:MULTISPECIES: ABC transporter ATP-binding protein [unclassified Fusibacter]|uniref:ATP-binding cassette domain-containing protein n=1 Tax=unclassified Fusibacter TaxID=2624464 RepID=UPI0010130F15|nr:MULTISPECIES: ABC transporter ATP-binding protein [unclassified Fusibacter]MCK8058960.1 ABC transporter ATP-binding protein/permease [Fusibacter sp. A2]NPE22037.1 ABC transporter ATP-binding protein [Fusibacter sp. A1]RXV61601.1 ABC transporter ATP-binding protein [Fusibacter sp. A1]